MLIFRSVRPSAAITHWRPRYGKIAMPMANDGIEAGLISIKPLAHIRGESIGQPSSRDRSLSRVPTPYGAHVHHSCRGPEEIPFRRTANDQGNARRRQRGRASHCRKRPNGGGGAPAKKEHQPHEPSCGSEPGPTLLGNEQTLRQPLPSAGIEGLELVSVPRCAGRSTNGQG